MTQHKNYQFNEHCRACSFLARFSEDASINLELYCANSDNFFPFIPLWCSVKTDLMEIGANSTLLVAKVNKTDSGNYTCSIGESQQYTVLVHVLNGKRSRSSCFTILRAACNSIFFFETSLGSSEKLILWVSYLFGNLSRCPLQARCF